MKPFAVFLLGCALAGGACSRKEPAATAAPTPPPNLAADAEKLQQAHMNAAAAHARSASPTPAQP